MRPTYVNLTIETPEQLNNIISIFGLDEVIESVSESEFSNLFNPYWKEVIQYIYDNDREIRYILKNSSIEIPDEVILKDIIDNDTRLDSWDLSTYYLPYYHRINRDLPDIIKTALDKYEDELLGFGRNSLYQELKEHYFGHYQVTLYDNHFLKTSSYLIGNSQHAFLTVENTNTLIELLSSVATIVNVSDHHIVTFYNKETINDMKTQLQKMASQYATENISYIKSLVGKNLNEVLGFDRTKYIVNSIEFDGNDVSGNITRIKKESVDIEFKMRIHKSVANQLDYVKRMLKACK